MKRKVFISPTNPLALFPNEKFTQKNEIYYNDSKIIITEFEFFALMTILELEEENEKISGKMKKFLYILNANERSIETLLSKRINIDMRSQWVDPERLHFHARKRLVLIFLLVDSISKEFKDGEEITEYVHKYIHEAKKYIEMNTQEIELNFKPLSPAMIARGQAIKKGFKSDSRTTKTLNNAYRIGIMKTTAKNFKFVEKAFIDFGYRGVHLDIIIITVADYKDIFLSVKPSISLSAIEILTTKYGKNVVKGDKLLAQTTSCEKPLEESKELQKFIVSNY